jgi:hypothetical protein
MVTIGQARKAFEALKIYNDAIGLIEGLAESGNEP